MSLKETKSHLTKLLAEPENLVIALSGKWGTGKTHLWDEIKKESADEKVKAALYVSLFGLSSIDQVKVKLVQSAASGSENKSLWDAAKQGFSATVKALEGYHKAFAALNELNLSIVVPVLLKEKIVLIDDIERKNEKLPIDEVLGFIDEFTKQYKTRFVLVLNSDQLAKKDSWETLREKVIDQEIRLLTTPEEAFTIALDLVSTPYEAALKKSVITCGLTNIRIIKKIITVANRVLDNKNVDDAILDRVIPSITLFSAIHYRGLENGPDLQFAMSVGSTDWMEWANVRDPEPSEDQKQRDKWRLLMQELGISGCDDFEPILVEFLESGMIDTERVTPIIEKYISETEILKFRQHVQEFFSKSFWDHRLSEVQLLDEAKIFLENARLLDPYQASELYEVLKDISGGEPIGESIVQAWVESTKASGASQFDTENPFNRTLHPAIAKRFEEIENDTETNTTVLDACMHIIDSSGWGATQEVVMNRATAKEFEEVIREATIEQLKPFLRRMIQMTVQRETYVRHFGTATERFLEACRTIANDPESPRLAKLIRRLFERTTIAAELSLTASLPSSKVPTVAQEA